MHRLPRDRERKGALTTMPRLRYFWDNQAVRFRNASGRFVAVAKVRESFEQSVKGHAARMLSLGNPLERGSIAAWQLGMADQIKSAHLTAYALASGGRAQLSQADLRAVQKEVGYHLKRLRRYSGQMARGERPWQPSRVAMYAEAARTTFWTVDQRKHADAGFLAYSKRGKSESCDECVSIEAATDPSRGGKPRRPDQIKPPGTRTCITKCGCRIVYVRP